MRVLMVEDEVRLADTVRRGLTDAGFVVELVHDGEDAVWAATEHSYDVIVLDIMLPKLNGYKVLEQLRDRGVWTPVLMLTAKDGEYDQTDAFDLGADDYLTKPFSFLVLIARLRALIRRGGPERPVVLTAGDLMLDPARRRVERAGQEIALTPARVRPARVPDASPRRHRQQTRDPGQRLGPRLRRRSRTWSRSTSATSASSSTPPSAATPSKPSAAWATASTPRAAEAWLFGDWWRWRPVS